MVFLIQYQVDKWDGCAVKNALDDTVKKIMIDTYGYAESHALMDGRLIICTVACLFALFAMVRMVHGFMMHLCISKGFSFANVGNTK